MLGVNLGSLLYGDVTVIYATKPITHDCFFFYIASIAHCLEPRPSDPAVVGSSPGADIYVPAILWPRTSWQIKAMPGTSFKKNITQLVKGLILHE